MIHFWVFWGSVIVVVIVEYWRWGWLLVIFVVVVVRQSGYYQYWQLLPLMSAEEM